MSNDKDNLKKEIDALKEENQTLKDRLQLYTNGKRSKRYYQNNSDFVKKKSVEYINKLKETNPEKLKEYRHTAYLNRKEKLKKQNDNAEKEKIDKKN
jgi:hypothetical protein